MHEFPQSERFASSGPQDTDAESRRISSGSGVADASPRNRALNEPELESALQLLVERAQYITGATGTALALPQGDEMVCRASAGSSAPAVGARLQVLSGLTGESIARRQLLRCDNAETDPRVNLEACRTLGIASIVVLPLFRQNGEVRGVIELFSDHPYAFEERDLVALERMADLTLTALDLAEQRDGAPQVTAPRRRELETPAELPNTRSVRDGFAVPRVEEFAEPRSLAADTPVSSSSTPAIVPEAMRRKQKCVACGFPVSEGRTFCLDCEKNDKIEAGRSGNRRFEAEEEQASTSKWLLEPSSGGRSSDEQSLSGNLASEEFVPAFLVKASVEKESWLSNHVILLAIIVLILVVLVAVVILR